MKLPLPIHFKPQICGHLFTLVYQDSDAECEEKAGKWCISYILISVYLLIIHFIPFSGVPQKFTYSFGT